MIAHREQLRLHDSIQGHAVNSNSWPLSDDDEKRALELEVNEERDVIGTLFTLGQFSEDQEAPPTLSTASDSHTLQDGGKRFEIAFGDAAGAHDPQGHDPAIEEKDIRNDDSDGEDPFGNLEGNLGLDLTRPLVEGEEIDGSESIGGVDGARDDDEDPQPNIGKGRETGG